MRSVVFRALYPDVTVRSSLTTLNPVDPYKRMRKLPEGWPRASPPGARRGSDLDQTPADGVPDDAGRVWRVELLHDPGPVRLDSLGADAEELGDLLRRVTLRDELQDFALPRRQRVRRQRRLRQVRLHQGARHERAQVHHAPQDLVDRPGQIRWRLGFDDEAVDTSPERFQDVVVVRVHGQEDHLRPRAGI